MSEVSIRNKEFLSVLNSFSDEMLSKPSYNDEKYWSYFNREDIYKGKEYTSREYLDECLSRYPQLVEHTHLHYSPITRLAVMSDGILTTMRMLIRSYSRGQRPEMGTSSTMIRRQTR